MFLRLISFSVAVLAFSTIANAECAIIKETPEQSAKSGDIVIGEEDDAVEGCPADARKLLETEQLCYFLEAEEISGADTLKTIHKMHCDEDSFYCYRKKILNKYKNDKTIYETTTNALKSIYPTDNTYSEYANQMEQMEKTQCLKY